MNEIELLLVVTRAVLEAAFESDFFFSGASFKFSSVLAFSTAAGDATFVDFSSFDFLQAKILEWLLG